MNEPIKILFDENLGEPLVDALASVMRWCEDPHEIVHLFKFSKSGEADEVWIPRIAPGGWMGFSTDKGKKCGGKKLPTICRENNVTHVLLSTAIHRAKQFEKIRAILSVWPRIILAEKSAKGSRFSLRYDGGEKRRVTLVEVPNYTITPSRGTPKRGFDGRLQKRIPNRVKRNLAMAIPESENIFKQKPDE